MIPKNNESKRRKLNPIYDSGISLFQKYNYGLAEPYIKDKKVLDIGCWNGTFEKKYSNYAKKIIGIDPGIEAIQNAKKRAPKAKFKVAFANKLPFKDNSFDTVVLFEVLEHIPKNQEIKTIKEIARVLKPKGYLIMSTPNKHILSILFDPAYFLTGHRHYSIKEINILFAKANIEVEKWHYSCKTTQLLVSNINLLAKHLLNTKITYPRWVTRRIKKDLGNGFTQMHVIARNQ